MEFVGIATVAIAGLAALVPAAWGAGEDAELLDEASLSSDTGVSLLSDSLTGYICGLTEADIADVTTYYGQSASYQTMLAESAAPFTCSEWGDLCRELGPQKAEQFACGVWDRLLAHESLTTAEPAIWADFELKQAQREANLFPNGIPSQEAWWGVLHTAPPPPPSPPSCSPSSDTSPTIDSFEQNDQRVRTTTFVIPIGPYKAIGATTKAFKFTSGAWRAWSVYVEQKTVFSGANDGSQCLEDCETPDALGTVSARDFNFLVWPDAKFVKAFGTFHPWISGMPTTEAARGAWWPGC